MAIIFETMYDEIFEKAYGCNISEASPASLAEIQKNILELRNSYKSNRPETPYEKNDIRNAYLLCYFPNYIFPIYEITKNILLPQISGISNLKLTFFAVGAGPEVLGCVTALSKQRCKIHIEMLDLEESWVNQRAITTQFMKKIPDMQLFRASHTSGCDVTNDCQLACKGFNRCKTNIFNSQLFFMQNCLNHISSSEYNYVAFIKKLRLMKKDAIFTIVDLEYNLSKQHMERLKAASTDFLDVIALGEGIAKLPFKMPDMFVQKLFTSETGLIPKTTTRYCYLILKKRVD